ncbi:MAG TPA: ABC transporter permease subunit [Rudaea sp.]|jgi:ABC-2 type transport system permease protein|nr:ABC transporter permease subunit [Rudaea sp.]
MSLIVARNELRRIFLTPLAWVLLAAVIGVLAYFFLLSLGAFLTLMPKIAGMADAPGVTDLVVLPLLRATASLLLLIAPLLGMRAIASDRQNGSLTLLLAAGVGDARIVVGKFLGLFAFVIVLILLSASISLSLDIGTSLDLGRIGAATFGLILFAAALIAIAVAASAATQSAALAASIALVSNLLLWMLDAGARYEGVSSTFINYLALPTHLEPFLHGIVATVDVIYFLLIVVVALALASRRVATLRTRG